MTGTARTLALTAVGPAIWGTTYYATTNWLPPGHPILDGAVRALPAGLALLALRPRLPRGVWIWRIAVLGMLNIGFFFPLLFLAAERLPGGIAGAIGAAQPLMVLGLSAVIIGNRVSPAALAAGLVGVLGVSLLVVRASGRIDLLGVAAATLGTALVGLAIVLTKRWGAPPMPPVTFTGWILTAGGLLLTPTALFTEGWPAHLSATNWFGLTYLAVFSGAVSYYLWIRGIGLLPAGAMSFLSLVVPVVAATVGWIALGQSMNAVQLAGLLVALGALVAGQRIATRSGTIGAWTPSRPASATPPPVISSSPLVGASREA